MKTVGIVDLGSNSVRVSVEYFAEDVHKTLFFDRKTVKLSENMNNDMYLKKDAIDRTIKALKECKTIFDSYGAERIVAVGTAAVRKAKNADEFLKTVQVETGINIKIIDGKTEAEFDFIAIKNSTDISDGVIVDIGGGSTEIIGIHSGKLLDYISIPYASRNVTELFINNEYHETVIKAEKDVFNIFSKVLWLDKYKNLPIIGIGGCLKALGKADSTKNNKEFLSGYTIPIESVYTQYKNIKTMTLENRIEMYGVNRGDIILGGAMCFISLAEIINPNYLYISDKGVRDGIILSIKHNLI